LELKPRLPHVLVLVYYFPPFQWAGDSIRTVKFLKYLAGDRFRFTLIAAAPEGSVPPADSDSSRYLLGEIPATVNVIRMPVPRRLPVRPLSTVIGNRWQDMVFATAESLWARRMFRTAIRVARSQGVDLLYASAPPYPILSVARKLKRKLQLPLLVDLRDDWIGDPPYQRMPRWLRSIEEARERAVVNAADRFVVVTEAMLASHRGRHPDQVEKFSYIPNGFDGAEFAGPASDTLATTDLFTIVTAGGYARRVRSPEAFLRALGLLARLRPGFRDHVRVRFFGVWLQRDFDSSELGSFGVRELIEEFAPPPRPELIRELRAANLLLCINAQSYNRAVPGKLYEYWAAASPPVLLLDDGASAARSFVDRHRLGATAHRDDVEAIARQIEDYYEAWLRGDPVTIGTEGMMRFDRRRLAVEMGDLIEGILVSRSRSPSPKA
jgi:glycosyltransferase involved in cell wall biosynthesis